MHRPYAGSTEQQVLKSIRKGAPKPPPGSEWNENATELELLPPPVQALRKAEAANLTCSLFNLDEVPGRGVTVMRINT